MKLKGIGLLVGLLQILPVFGSLLENMAAGVSAGIFSAEALPFIKIQNMHRFYQSHIPVNVFMSEEVLPLLPAPLVSDPLEIVKGPLYQLEDHRLLRLLRKNRQYFIQLELKPSRVDGSIKTDIKSVSTVVYDEGETFTFWLPENRQSEKGIQIEVCLAENSVIESLIREYLSIYFGDVEDYTVSQTTDGSIQISVWKKGVLINLTLKQLLMKLGEWHYFFFEVYLQGRYGRSHCTSVYVPGSSSAEYIPVYSPAKKKIKGDNPTHSEEVTDGNTGSRSTKKGEATGGGAPEPNPSKVQTQNKPEQGGKDVPDGPLDFEAVSREQPDGQNKGGAQANPSQDLTRFRMMRAMNDLVTKRQIQEGRGKGVKKLAEFIHGEHEVALRKEFDSVSRSPGAALPVFLADILVQGYTAQLARFLLTRFDEAQLNLFKDELNTVLRQQTFRVRRAGQTQIRRGKENNQYPLVVSILEELGSAGGAGDSGCSLAKLNEKGWDIVLSQGKNEVVYHHDQHRQMVEEGLPALAGAELSKRMLVDLLAAMGLFLQDDALRDDVIQEICSVVPVDVDSTVKEKMQSVGLNQGILEISLGLQEFVRLRGHPNVFAGTVLLSERPRKHVEILLRGGYVEIRVSMEFSSVTLTRPDGRTQTLRMQLGIRNHYRFYTETSSLETSRSEVVLSPPQIPPGPTEEEQKAWLEAAQKRYENTVRNGLVKSRESYAKYKEEVEDRNDDSLMSLSPPSRQFKVAWQKLKSLRGLVEEWQLDKDELMDQYAELKQATRVYLESVRAALRAMGTTQAESHPHGQALINKYVRLVEQSIDHLEAMQRLAEQKAQPQFNRREMEEQIRKWVESHEALGDTFRYDTRSELPVERSERVNDGTMTQEQKTVTSYLVDIYYVMTSAFTVEKQMVLADVNGSGNLELQSEDEPAAEALIQPSEEEGGTAEPVLPFRVIDEGDDSPDTPDEVMSENNQ
ncbi:hypothetical protein [Endozoicomonas numazuensis]|uniref:Uncharacterized protein n=1 Tax=Endozoicomonas numazuensis TaxID=1137799 RepID=A0A081NFJ8_9GAMM|nr:hypothetical protein [Endozoicomonas numazuensis]KEQ17221.1 hypothetical protein GZ78_15425 [Endozoicomonas numazuensis]